MGNGNGGGSVQHYAGQAEQRESLGLAEFLEEMAAMVSTHREASRQVFETERLLARLIRDPSWLRPEWTAPCAEKYARYVVHRDPLERFEVIALVWQPGQSTLLHDHDGTWGVEGVVRGAVTITSFLQAGDVGPDLVRLRELETVVVGAQETGQLLPPADCHIVANRGTETAVTVHVYGKPLRHFRVFRATDEPDLYHWEVVRVHSTDGSAT